MKTRKANACPLEGLEQLHRCGRRVCAAPGGPLQPETNKRWLERKTAAALTAWGHGGGG
ncbi:MAG: hypothetical protein WCZ18_10100 [Ottowia sp.]